ncbi:MAG: DsbA family protein [Anaerolineae bacterium]|nr:DsbA family protein [Anaerolineae bacterium]
MTGQRCRPWHTIGNKWYLLLLVAVIVFVAVGCGVEFPTATADEPVADSVGGDLSSPAQSTPGTLLDNDGADLEVLATPTAKPLPPTETIAPTEETIDLPQPLPEGLIPERFGAFQGYPYDAGETDARYPYALSGRRLFPALGSADAPVVVQEFTEVFCGHCHNFVLNEMDEFLSEYVSSGQVLYVGHFFGFARTESLSYVEASMCAAEQGRYFAYVHAVFDDLSNNGAFDLLEAAAASELEIDQFTACLETGRYRPAVQDALEHAQGMGLHATPTFFVNDTKVEGYRPDEIRRLIEAALKRDTSSNAD